MQTMRESWTDERLDDLNEKVDRGFDRVDARFEQVDRRFERVDERFDALGAQINERFDAMQRTMIQSAAVVVAALSGVIATQL
jgi:chaperonin cofactor prefoldin